MTADEIYWIACRLNTLSHRRSDSVGRLVAWCRRSLN